MTATITIDHFEQQLGAEQQNSPSYSDFEGNISGMSAPKNKGAPDYDKQFDTLDEPVWDTVKRDMHAVGSKFTHVLYPAKDESLLRDWDLWGPLFICVFMSLLVEQSSMAFLGGSHPPRRKALAIYPIFLFYFVISWMVASHS